MNGPNEFFVTGTLNNWNIIPELHKIDGKRRLRPIGYPPFAFTAEERVSS